MVKFSTLLAILPCAAAFPQVMELNENFEKRTPVGPRKPLFLSGRKNTGVKPELAFNAAEQYVDVSSKSGHAYKFPKSTDQRGECPGLNAAANHGFIPRNGLPTITQTITGLGDAYNMSPDLALALAVISVGLGGNPLTEQWSIGGPFSSGITGVPATGILNFHNQYESDSSIVHGDAYLNKGDVGVFQYRSWEHFYNSATHYTLDVAAKQSDYVTRWSKANNPYYFSGPFAGAVSAAAHNFVINFMSNHSAASPGGVLDRYVLKSFFGVTGNKNGQFVQHPGTERIPDNWYKRPTINQYTLPDVVADVQINNAMYPGIANIGGNTGKVNTFTGVDFSDLTGGVFSADTLTKGNNGACFLLQASMQGLPDATDPALGKIGSVLNFVTQKFAPLNRELGCPPLKRFNSTLFNKFPGYKYKAKGQSTVRF